MSSSKSISWWQSPRAILRAVLSLNDTPHNIAKGTAIGMFIAFTPTVGIQMILVMIVAIFAKFNRKAALITVYISNPFTTIPIYWANYKIGTLFFKGTVSHDKFIEVFTYNNFTEWWESIQAIFMSIGLPLLFGSLIVSTVVGLATYPLVRWLLRVSGKDVVPESSTELAARTPVKTEVVETPPPKVVEASVGS